MSNQLCQSGYEVVGVDMNTLELDQAKRLLEKEQLTFVNGDVFRDLDIGKFDCVVISAAL
jgi:nucleoside-diphosphate-sugar epimerase